MAERIEYLSSRRLQMIVRSYVNSLIFELQCLGEKLTTSFVGCEVGARDLVSPAVKSATRAHA